MTYESDVIQHELDALTVRFDALRQDIFNELGRITYMINNYGLQDSTRKSLQNQRNTLQILLRKDDERA